MAARRYTRKLERHVHRQVEEVRDPDFRFLLFLGLLEHLPAEPSYEEAKDKEGAVVEPVLRFARDVTIVLPREVVFRFELLPMSVLVQKPITLALVPRVDAEHTVHPADRSKDDDPIDLVAALC